MFVISCLRHSCKSYGMSAQWSDGCTSMSLHLSRYLCLCACSSSSVHERFLINQENTRKYIQCCCLTKSVEEQVEGHVLMTSFYYNILLGQVQLCTSGPKCSLGCAFPARITLLNWQRVGDWHWTEGLISSRLWHATCWKIYSDKCHPVLLNVALKGKLSPCQETATLDSFALCPYRHAWC